jgi:hypothetical protein
MTAVSWQERAKTQLRLMIPGIPALQTLKQEDCTFKARLGLHSKTLSQKKERKEICTTTEKVLTSRYVMTFKK